MFRTLASHCGSIFFRDNTARDSEHHLLYMRVMLR